MNIRCRTIIVPHLCSRKVNKLFEIILFNIIILASYNRFYLVALSFTAISHVPLKPLKPSNPFLLRVL